MTTSERPASNDSVKSKAKTVNETTGSKGSDETSKPNFSVFEKERNKLRKQKDEANETLNSVREKLNKLGTADNTEREEILAKIKALRQQEDVFKKRNNASFEEIKATSEALKRKDNELSSLQSRLPVKSLKELESRINYLEKQVEAGTLSLVDEKKYLKEASQLKQSRKSFTALSALEADIGDLRKKLSEIKKTIDNTEINNIRGQIQKFSDRLTAIKASQQDHYKQLNALRDQRTAAYDERKKLSDEISALTEKFNQRMRAWEKQEEEKRKQYKEEMKKVKLEEEILLASKPAYLAQIAEAESLLTYFDPSYKKEETAKEEKSSLNRKVANKRQINAPDGVVLKKDNKADEKEDFFFSGKKSKKRDHSNNSTTHATSNANKISLSPDLIAGLGNLHIGIPYSPSEIPNTVEQLKEKIAWYKENQEAKTKENIEAAKAKVNKLNEEASTAVEA